MTNQQQALMKLIQRSPDIGDGWRQVSDVLWKSVVDVLPPDLVDTNKELKQIRLTPLGEGVLRYV